MKPDHKAAKEYAVFSEVNPSASHDLRILATCYLELTRLAEAVIDHPHAWSLEALRNFLEGKK